MMHTKDKTISAYWPKQSPFSLGNLLIFRQELELLAQIRSATKITIYFEENNDALPFYFEDAFQSQIPIHPYFSQKILQKVDWPPKDPEVGRWPYSSFRRVSLLKEISGISPQLLWPSEILEEAKQHYLECKPRRIIAVHLKQQSGGREESNAELGEWAKVFEKNKEEQFILLGKDKISESITGLPNVKTSTELKMSLPVELAFCGMADAFLGMASGICPGAFFSSTPYVVFKHPSHHEKEMQFEIGEQDHFPFSLQTQKLWRKLDDQEHVVAAMEFVRAGYKKEADE